MNKEFLLAKSNFRKNKGTGIGVFLLILLAAMLLSLALLILLDIKPTADKEAKRLKSGNGVMVVQTIDENINEDYVKNVLLADKVNWSQFTECIFFHYSQAIPFGNGKISNCLIINDERVFNNEYDRIEIVKEDKNVNSPYVYLPYQMNTTGGFELGDTFSIELNGKKRDYTIKGFVNTTYFGCNNIGTYRMIFDAESYSSLWEESKDEYASLLVNYELKDDVKMSKFKLMTGNRFVADREKGAIATWDLESVNSDKTFMADILLISFLMVSIIIILVTSLMLSNCIRNYIRENMTNLGALKAIGFTSRNLRASLLIMFTGLALIGSIIGAALSYLLVPVMAGIFEGQSGVPYKLHFNTLALLVSAVFILLFTMLVTVIASRRLKKVEVVTALRNGTKNHNFRKNRVPLDRSNLSLNMSLSLKTLFSNLKQNITTFFVTGLLVFVCVIGLLMYENFNRKPMLSMFNFEICSGYIGVSKEAAPEVEKFITDMGAENIRYLIDMYLKYKDEESLETWIVKDVSKLNNKDYCYKGRFPKHENEVAVSGKFAKEYGFSIGDEIELAHGDEKFSYLITGLVQSLNNGGREAIMSEEAAGHVLDMSKYPTSIWFDVDGKEETKKILDACTEKFGDSIESTLSFDEALEGMLTTFRSITTLMLAMMLIISAAVIMLILYLFMKTLLYNKKKDYGIYKAIGYTSKDLILQTAASFMPTIIISVIIFSIVSYFIANPYMQTIMIAFGLMKCTFTIPVAGVIIIGVGMIALAFFFAVFQARKIRKIEPYNMLTEN